MLYQGDGIYQVKAETLERNVSSHVEDRRQGIIESFAWVSQLGDTALNLQFISVNFFLSLVIRE